MNGWVQTQRNNSKDDLHISISRREYEVTPSRLISNGSSPRWDEPLGTDHGSTSCSSKGIQERIMHSPRRCVDKKNPYLGYFFFAEEKRVQEEENRSGCSFFERHDLLSTELIKEKRECKMHPLRGVFHFSPGKYSKLHPQYKKLKLREVGRKATSLDDNYLGPISDVSQRLFRRLNEEAPQIVSDYYAHRNLLRTLELGDLNDALGTGSYANVLLAKLGNGRHKLAVKYFKKLSPTLYSRSEIEAQEKQIKNEVSIMKLLGRGSKHLVRLIDYLELPGKVHVVMELCTAGDLEKMLYLRRKLAEEETVIIAIQMLKALAYMHEMGIVHGDIKAANIVFQVKQNFSLNGALAKRNNVIFRSPIGLTLKICDFGASRKISDPVSLGSSSFDSLDEGGFYPSIPFEMIGTEGYLSPEQLKGLPLTTAIDMWSFGVVIFKCFTGYLPYRPSSSCLTNSSINFDGPLWQQVTAESKAFVRRCLDMDPFYRCTAKEGMGWSIFSSSLEDLIPVEKFEPIKSLGDKERSLISFLEEVNDDESRANFVITDPELPDNPIVHVSSPFCVLTGYSKASIFIVF